MKKNPTMGFKLRVIHETHVYIGPTTYYSHSKFHVYMAYCSNHSLTGDSYLDGKIIRHQTHTTWGHNFKETHATLARQGQSIESTRHFLKGLTITHVCDSSNTKGQRKSYSSYLTLYV
jgi:hypothetical protein